MNQTPKPPKRLPKRLRFTLGLILLLIVALGGKFAWTVQGAKEQRLAVARILKSPGATIRYDWKSLNSRKIPDKKPQGPKWLRDMLGVDVFDTVVQVNLPNFGKDPDLLLEVGKLRSLEMLSLTGLGEPLSAKLVAQVAPLKNLYLFTVNNVPNAEAFLPHLADKLQLTYLAFWQCGKPTDADMAYLSELTSLDNLRLDGNLITDAGFTHLSNLKNIRTLHLQGVRISSLEPLRDHNALVSVNLGERFDARDGRLLTNLEPLHDLPNLQSLTLGQNPIDDAGIREIGILPKLVTLEASGSRLSTRALVTLSQQPVLSSLYIGGPEINDSRLRLLADAPSLKVLWLYNTSVKDLRVVWRLLEKLNTFLVVNAPLENDGLQALANLPLLQTLGLDRCPITEAGLSKIDKLPMLHTLLIDHMPIGDSAIAGLARFPRLETLSWKNKTLTNSGIADFAKSTKLRFLRLSETNVTDAAIPFLLQIPRLNSIDIDETKITSEGETQLLKARPKTRILKIWIRDPS